jgi:hypothetical protein
MANFAQHLKNRGHDMLAVETIMLEAAKRIDNGIQSNYKKSNKKQTTQKHFTYIGSITHVILRKMPSGRHTPLPSWAKMDSTI